MSWLLEALKMLVRIFADVEVELPDGNAVDVNLVKNWFFVDRNTRNSYWTFELFQVLGAFAVWGHGRTVVALESFHGAVKIRQVGASIVVVVTWAISYFFGNWPKLFLKVCLNLAHEWVVIDQSATSLLLGLCLQEGRVLLGREAVLIGRVELACICRFFLVLKRGLWTWWLQVKANFGVELLFEGLHRSLFCALVFLDAGLWLSILFARRSSPLFGAFQVINLGLWHLEFLELVFNLRNVFALEVLVESVFDLADSSPEEQVHFWNLGPPGAYFLMHLEDEEVFFLSPLSSNNGRVNHVVPPFSALSAKTTRKKSSDDDPVLGSKLVDLGPQNVIFFLGPLGTADLCLE